MADVQLISAIIFLALLSLFLWKNKSKLITQPILGPLLYFSMWRTKLGLKFMDKASHKYKTLTKYLAYLGVIIGFAGMGLICYSLVQNIITLFMTPEAAPGVGLVLPFKVKGAFYVPFFYWIISIFIIATVHEFSHGFVARRYNIPVKSSGFAFLGVLIPIVPAAFVEPDEKVLKKRPYREQLSVFAAGPFSNILLAFLVIGLIALFAGPISNVFAYDGVEITGLIEGTDKAWPAEVAGIGEGEIVKSINGRPIETLQNFSAILDGHGPGDAIKLSTDKKIYDVVLGENPDNSSQSYLGVYVQQSTKVNKETLGSWSFIAPVLSWVMGLFYWLYILNLGIGLFNLVPIGPIDGGRMLQLALRKFFPEKKADKAWKYVGLFFLGLVLINIFFGFMK